MTSSGLHLHQVQPLGLESGRKAHLLNIGTLRVFEDLFATQYVIRVGKTERFDLI